MSRKHKKQQSFWNSLWSNIVQHIDVQTDKRTLLMSLIIYLHYIVDYIILWVIIESAYIITAVISFDWPFIVARSVFAALFIILKHPIFFLSNKITILVQILFCMESFLMLEVLACAIEILMSGVWSLTKEQRMIHFDSRFQIFGAFLKQTVFYIVLTIQFFFTLGTVQLDNQFLFLGALSLLLIIDSNEVYYNKIAKTMFIRLDFILILLTIITIYKDTISIDYIQFIFCSLFMFLVSGLHLAFSPANNFSLFKFNSQDIKNFTEDTMIEVLVYLKRHTQSKDLEGIETYLYKLKGETQDPLFVEKIQDCQQKNAASKKELLSNFIFQALKKGAKSSKKLRDLVIYLYSPSPRLYCFLDLDDWQHLREYKRIISQELNDSTLREAQAEKELQEVKKVIQKYTKVSNILLQQLMKERIQENKVEDYGQQLIQLLQELQKISASDHSKSSEVRNLINRFALDCLPAKYHTAIVKQPQQQSEVLREDFGELVFGAEQDNYFTVLEGNSCFIKICYFKKEKYIGKHLSEILPPSFISHLSKDLKNVNRSEEKVDLKPAFLFNNLGFLVICKFKVEATTHRSGRAWKLSMKQEMLDRNILLISPEGYLQGFSQLCRYFGLGQYQKSKKIDPQIIKQLQTSSSFFLTIGENLFQSHPFQSQKKANLSLLDEMKLGPNRFLLVEIKHSQSRMKSVALSLYNNQVKDPPDFQFHFDWASNKITTESYPQNITFSASFHQQQRVLVNYGENITEMRYFQEKIDYKSNFQEERDCPSLQPHLERALSSLSINQFYQKWDRKKNSAPLWFKVSAVLAILICIVGLVAAIFFLTQFNQINSTAQSNLLIITKLQQKLQSVVLLGQMTTLPFYNSSINVTQSINNQIIFSNSLSSTLYSLNQNIFNINGGQTLLDLLNTLNLYINSYLLNSNYNYKTILSLITKSIVPNFQAFITSMVNSYSSSSNNVQRTAVMICMVVICFGLFVIIWLIDFRQTFRRRQVAEILKFIDNDDLQAMRDKIIRFKETWLDNLDCKEFQEYADEPSKENISPPKHLISSFRIRKRKFFHIAWLGIFVTCLILINNQINDFWKLSRNYIYFQNNLASQLTNLQAIYAEFSNSPSNITLIKNLVSDSLKNEYNKHSMLKQMASNGQIQKKFVQQYGQFWETEASCNYFSDSKCGAIIGGAMAEGVNMAICYLNIEHDNYQSNNMTNFTFFKQTTYPSVTLISLYYLPVITQVNNGYIIDEFHLMTNRVNINVQYNFIGIILHSLLALILFKWMIKQRKTNSRIEELLMVMPFEKLKNFSAFHKYYLKYYANY